MRKLLLITMIALTGCHRVDEHHYTKTQQDTIRMASFSKMDEKEAYDFINNYYLPHLDTLATERKIFMYPMKAPDLLAKYINKLNGKKDQQDMDQFFWGNDSSYRWDQNKLKHVKIVSDKDLAEINKYKGKDGATYSDSLYCAKWHQQVGYGYVCISYPRYNPYTKRIFFYEWIENLSGCGMARSNKFWYKKIGNKWVTF